MSLPSQSTLPRTLCCHPIVLLFMGISGFYGSSRESSQRHINYGLCIARLLKLNLLCPSKSVSLGCIPFRPVNPTATGVKLWYPNKFHKCTHSRPSATYTRPLFLHCRCKRNGFLSPRSGGTVGGVTSVTPLRPPCQRPPSSSSAEWSRCSLKNVDTQPRR